MGALICDFGKKPDGKNLLRINGDEKQIKKAIKNLEKEGCKFQKPYTIENIRGSEFTCIVRVQIPITEKELQGELT